MTTANPPLPGSPPVTGLIMTGGGARAAYQVGVLRALRELLSAGGPLPFPVTCGTSAGAINAAVLAGEADDFTRGVERLLAVWENFHVSQVYRADAFGALANSARWLAAALSGGRLDGPVSLLDNSPLARLLARHMDFAAVGRHIQSGCLQAFAVTCSGYTSGRSVTFYQGREGLAGWERARRIGVAMPIRREHLLASSALPFIFPPVLIDGQYYGDGSMRQIAPVSPALHLGADRLLVIGVGRQSSQAAVPQPSNGFPPLAQIAGHALDSIFLDSMEVDLERLQRINRTLAIIPPETLAQNGYPLREVEYRVITPSVPLSRIALDYVQELPRVIRGLLHTVGAMKRSGSNLVSYLLFEQGFCRALIALGHADTMAQADDLRAFLAGTR